MNLEEVKNLKELGGSPFTIRSRSQFKDGLINVNHKIALKVDSVASYFDCNSDISIFNSSGIEIGALCFTKEIEETNWRELTENQFIAFINEGDFSTREENYKFKFNYVIINDSYYDDYITNHKDNSPLWGGFNHVSNDLLSYEKTVSRIDIKDLNIVNGVFRENSKKAVLQPFAHERFLKFYHLLELRFDIDVINEVKSLDYDVEPEKIGKIFNDYSQTELIRLKRIVESNCVDISPLVLLLNNLSSYQSLATDIFYKFGKPSNPIKVEADFITILPFGFQESYLISNSINYQRNYAKFIQDLVSYYIYRIRCCIAHNKIGEYILSHNDEEFIVEFAEPLILEVLRQTFRR